MITGVFPQDLPTLLTGLAAATCLTMAPACRSRQSILIMQLAAGLFFAAHYLCLGISGGAQANILGSIQTAAAIFASRNAVMHRLGYALIGLMIMLALVFWQGPITLLSILAMALISFGRMQAAELRLRALVLAGDGFWVMHDFLGEAWIALAADLGALTVGAAAILALTVRIRIEWRPAEAHAF